MQKYLSIFCALCISIGGTHLHAQVLIPDQNEKGKWGYVTENGDKAIDYQYDEAEFFMSGRAKVRKGDNYGYIDANNRQIIPIRYNSIDVYNKNIYKVSTDGKYKDGVLFDEKYGYISIDGDEILKPEYDEVGPFIDHMAYIKKDDCYGYINDSIRIIIPCKYKAVGAFSSDGYVWVNDGCSFEKNSTKKFTGGKYGIYDKTGKEILPVKYKTAGIFIPFEYTYSKASLDRMTQTDRTICVEGSTHRMLRKWSIKTELFSSFANDIHGFWGSTKKEGHKNCVVDRTGKVIIEEGEYDHVFYPEEGFAIIKEKTSFNYLNVASGKKLLEKNVAEAWAFKNGRAVIKDGSYFMIDNTGKKTTPAYTKIYPEKGGVYIVKSQNKYGLLDKNGTEILRPEHASIYPYSHGLLRMQEQEDGTIGFIDTTGKYVVESKYINAQSFRFGYASVKSADGWGEIDPTGKEIVKCRWNNSYDKTAENPRYLWVQKAKGEKWYCLDMTTDSIAFDTGYDKCSNFDRYIEGIAIVGTDKDHLGCIDTTGKVIIPLEMSSNDMVTKAYQMFIESGKDEWGEIDSYRFKIYYNDERNGYSLSDTIDNSLWDF